MFRTAISHIASSSRPALVQTARRGVVAAKPMVNATPAFAVNAKRGYHAKVIDHYENPRNVGTMNKNDQDVGTGLVGAPACGDVMKLQIKVDDDGIITDVKFKTFGCGSAIASSSYMTERVRGLSLENAGKIKNTDIAKELCLPPVKLHCSMLAEDAIRSAIKDYRSKRTKTGKGMPSEVEVAVTPSNASEAAAAAATASTSSASSSAPAS